MSNFYLDGKKLFFENYEEAIKEICSCGAEQPALTPWHKDYCTAPRLMTEINCNADGCGAKFLSPAFNPARYCPECARNNNHKNPPDVPKGYAYFGTPARIIGVYSLNPDNSLRILKRDTVYSDATGDMYAPADTAIIYTQSYFIWMGYNAPEILGRLIEERAKKLALKNSGVEDGMEKFSEGCDGCNCNYNFCTNIPKGIVWRGQEGIVESPVTAFHTTNSWKLGEGYSSQSDTYGIYCHPNTTIIVEDTKDGDRMDIHIHSGSQVPDWFKEAEKALLFKILAMPAGTKINRKFLGIFDIEKMSKNFHEVAEERGKERWIFWTFYRYSRKGLKETVLFKVPVYFPKAKKWSIWEYPVSTLRKELKKLGLHFNK